MAYSERESPREPARDTYSPELLEPIPRSAGRSRLGLRDPLPFSGVDIWNSYELSWLDLRGKPTAAMAELRFPASSPNLIESKSLKLYLNSLGQTRYASAQAVDAVLRADLGRAGGAPAEVRITAVASGEPPAAAPLPGYCLDALPVEISTYDYDPEILNGAADDGSRVTETVYSHAFKSNCPVTGQPDWASVLLRYRGAKIRRDRLFTYLISFRRHAEFHEQCVERIFVDIDRYCRPEALTVYARYTRRGGLDINPFRSNFETAPENKRVLRQ